MRTIFKMQKDLQKMYGEIRVKRAAEAIRREDMTKEGHEAYGVVANDWIWQHQVCGDLKDLENLHEIDKIMWIELFMSAIDDELRELEICFETPKTDIQNARVEVIDIWHFLVSASIAAGLDPDNMLLYMAKNMRNPFTDAFLENRPETVHKPDIFSVVRGMDKYRRAIVNCFNWKWWSDPEPVDWDMVTKSLIHFWRYLFLASISVGLSLSGVIDIYKKKWEINKQRQEKGYSKSTKDESDNSTVVLD